MLTQSKRTTAATVALSNTALLGGTNINPTQMDLTMNTHIIAPAEGATAMLCHREEAANYDRVLIQLDDGWRLIECKDAIQFILQRKSPQTVVGARWRNVRYHRASDTLPEACRHLGITLTSSQVAAISALPRICRRAQ